MSLNKFKIFDYECPCCQGSNYAFLYGTSSTNLNGNVYCINISNKLTLANNSYLSNSEVLRILIDSKRIEHAINQIEGRAIECFKGKFKTLSSEFSGTNGGLKDFDKDFLECDYCGIYILPSFKIPN